MDSSPEPNPPPKRRKPSQKAKEAAEAGESRRLVKKKVVKRRKPATAEVLPSVEEDTEEPASAQAQHPEVVVVYSDEDAVNKVLPRSQRNTDSVLHEFEDEDIVWHLQYSVKAGQRIHKGK